MAFSQVAAHEQACPARAVECELCHIVLPLPKKPEHANICPEAPQQCPYHDVGCRVALVRREVEAHLANATAQHLRLVTTEYPQRLARLEDKLLDRLERLEHPKSSSPLLVVNWTLPYSSLQTKYVQSPYFRHGDMQWFLGCYPQGDSEPGYCAPYLFGVGESFLGRRISVRFSLSVVGRDGPFNERRFAAMFPVRGGSGWGDRRFLPTAQLPVLNNSTLTLRLELTLVRYEIDLK